MYHLGYKQTKIDNMRGISKLNSKLSEMSNINPKSEKEGIIL